MMVPTMMLSPKPVAVSRSWQRIRFPWWRLLGSARANDWVEVLQRHRPAGGDYLCFGPPGPAKIYIVCNPDAIQRIFADQSGLYCRGEPRWTPLRRVLGDGLITADGERHRRNRRVLAKLFKADWLQQQAQHVQVFTEQWISRWREAAGSTVDVHEEMILITLKCIGKMLFNISFEEELRFGRIFKNLNALTNRIDVAVFSLVPWLPVRVNRTLKHGIREIDAYIGQMIWQHRERNAPAAADALDYLLSVQAEAGWDDRQLRDELVTLFGAGHESVAAALTWSWYLLDRYPDIADRVRREADRVLTQDRPAYEQLQHLVYTRQVLRESMRLYPPVWFNGRKTTRATEIDGHPLPAGARVWLLPFLVHRDPRWFPQPTVMCPQRFDQSSNLAFNAKAYFPFGKGARMCLGHFFAEMEATLILAGLARHFRLHRTNRTEPRLNAGTTLYPRGGMPMTVMPHPQEAPCS